MEGKSYKSVSKKPHFIMRETDAANSKAAGGDEDFEVDVRRRMAMVEPPVPRSRTSRIGTEIGIPRRFRAFVRSPTRRDIVSLRRRRREIFFVGG